MKKSRITGSRSASNESVSTVYLSCSSMFGDERRSPSTQYRSFSLSSNKSTKESPLGKSIRELGSIKCTNEESQDHTETASPIVPKYYHLLKEGSELSMIYGGPGDTLVNIRGTIRSSGNGVLSQPIYMFNSAVSWHHAARIMMTDLTLDGVYFVGLFWKFNRPYERSDGTLHDAKEPFVLNCFCKEPQKRFQGRIGPISVFVPHHEEKIDKRIAGIWVSLFSDQILAEFFNEIPFFESKYRSKLKTVDESYEQMMFFVSDDAACVGIQVLHTKQEEKQIKKSKKEYHHGRPLILQDGFYLVEGKFTSNFLNGDENSQFDLDCRTSSGPKLIILGEGTHLIRTETTQISSAQVSSDKPKKRAKRRRNRRKGFYRKSSLPKSDKISLSGNSSSISEMSNSEISSPNKESSGWLDGNKVNKVRKVEVCIDKRYERLTVLDQNVLKKDFEEE